MSRNRWQIIYVIFRTSLRVLFKKLFRENFGAAGVIYVALIPNAPNPSYARFAFLARGLLDDLCEAFSFLHTTRRTLLQDLLCFWKLARKDLQYFYFLPTQRTAFGLQLYTLDRVE